MAGRVVHCKKEPYDVYIGRPSKWQNIFSHLPNSSAEYIVSSREEAIELFEMWVVHQPELMRDLSELKGKVLGCWCHPKPCHGDILLRLANGT